MSPIGAAEAFERAPGLANRIGEGDPETLIEQRYDVARALKLFEDANAR